MRSGSTSRRRSGWFRRRRRATRTPRRSSRRWAAGGGSVPAKRRPPRRSESESAKRNFTESYSMTRRMLIMLAVVGVVFGGILGWQLFGKPYMMRKFIPVGVIPPQTVSTAKAGFSEWQGEFQAVGTLRAVRGADIAPEVAGVPLVQLNAESDLARLQSLAAAAELAEVNDQRDQKQLEIQAVSRAVVDADAANLKSAKAQLAEQQALVNKKLVRAPFDGRLGIRAVDL